MVLGIGTDIIEISRIKKALENEKFKMRVYTELEIIESEKKGINKYETYAGKFSAKEAVAKAIGSGVKDFSMTDIEIISNEVGKPNVYFKRELYNKMLGKSVEISVSHCKEYATAVAILVKGEN